MEEVKFKPKSCSLDIPCELCTMGKVCDIAIATRELERLKRVNKKGGNK